MPEAAVVPVSVCARGKPFADQDCGDGRSRKPEDGRTRDTGGAGLQQLVTVFVSSAEMQSTQQPYRRKLHRSIQQGRRNNSPRGP